MKSIGLSDEVYELLLHTKHMYERAMGEVLSYDRIIRKLIERNGEDGSNNKIKK